ncbi:hypothetical protein DFP72DRAFT_858164 [Ephemerocybe angulata]|uniref:Uncharacterized protein n=1 Tax=Ephemerocybe angulata TaxID=980116 RepID=A0A8H6HBG7_9AGAR|nr:hypothetical protein DFP72DRAFT_858164 [Tulosesus angulatus]
MVRGRKSKVFSDDQSKVLWKEADVMYTWLDSQDRTKKSFAKVFTQWKQNQADDILSRGLTEFASIIPPKPSDPGDENAHDSYQKALGTYSPHIVSFFTNRFNQNYKSKVDPSQPAQPASSKSSSIPGYSDSQEERVLQAIRRAFVILKGAYSARELWIDECDLEIKDEETRIRNTQSLDNALSGGALRNVAIANLWKGMDDNRRREWEAKAQKMAHDVTENQEYFPYIMTEALRSMIMRKQLGSVVLKFAYALRRNDGILDSGISYVGYDASKDTEIEVQLEDDEEEKADWCALADGVLPKVLKEEIPSISCKFPKNKDGEILFPPVDLDMVTAQQLQELLDMYFRRLWEEASKGCTTVPRANIIAEPDRYIDIARFPRLPKSLIFPTSRGEVLSLAEYLIELTDAGQPFQFRMTAESTLETVKPEMDTEELEAPLRLITSDDDLQALRAIGAQQGVATSSLGSVHTEKEHSPAPASPRSPSLRLGLSDDQPISSPWHTPPPAESSPTDTGSGGKRKRASEIPPPESPRSKGSSPGREPSPTNDLPGPEPSPTNDLPGREPSLTHDLAGATTRLAKRRKTAKWYGYVGKNGEILDEPPSADNVEDVETPETKPSPEKGRGRRKRTEVKSYRV